MDLNQLAKLVRPCLILDFDVLIDAIQEREASSSMRYRGALRKWNKIYDLGTCSLNSLFLGEKLGPEENVATAEHNAKTIIGTVPSVLLNGDVTSYSSNDEGTILLSYTSFTTWFYSEYPKL